MMELVDREGDMVMDDQGRLLLLKQDGTVWEPTHREIADRPNQVFELMRRQVVRTSDLPARGQAMIKSKRVKVTEVQGSPPAGKSTAETERYLDATLYRDTETGAERLVLDPLPELPELKPLPKDTSSPPTN